MIGWIPLAPHVLPPRPAELNNVSDHASEQKDSTAYQQDIDHASDKSGYSDNTSHDTSDTSPRCWWWYDASNPWHIEWPKVIESCDWTKQLIGFETSRDLVL